MKTEVLICVVGRDLSIRQTVARLFQHKKYRMECFASSESFLKENAHHGPCCLVLEVRGPTLHGLNLQLRLSKDRRTEQIVFISTRADVAMCAKAFKAGAVDFLIKPLKEAELLPAVEEGLIRSEQLFRLRQEKQAAQALLDKLTPREREVLGFVIAGRMNKVIAAVLCTTEKTVKKHRGRITEKLNVSSVAELVHLCLTCGLKPAYPWGDQSPLYSYEANS